MKLACATVLALGCDTSSAIDLPGDSNGNIARIAKTDSAMLETISSGQNGPTSLDVTTDRVCWVNTGDHAADFTNGSCPWRSTHRAS